MSTVNGVVKAPPLVQELLQLSPAVAHEQLRVLVYKIAREHPHSAHEAAKH
jgi:hypothetical protein